MADILDGKVVVQKIKEELKEQVNSLALNDKYLAIIYLGDNSASKTYVSKKKKFGESIWLKVEVFGQGKDASEYFSEDETLQFYQKQDYDSVPKVIEIIHYLNYDKDCIGIIVQLPLPEQFQAYQAQILSAVQANKDVDGLWGVINGWSQVWLIDFLPATPRAVVEILKYYHLDNVQAKTIAILWQSNLVGKPLSVELMKKWATIYSTNQSNDPNKVKQACKNADYIISATGKIHLIDETYLADTHQQVLIDVGYGYKDGNPVGDIQIDKIKDKCLAYTPVPWGIWPITVACLFQNIIDLQSLKNQ